jgi:hypothetical protein
MNSFIEGNKLTKAASLAFFATVQQQQQFPKKQGLFRLNLSVWYPAFCEIAQSSLAGQWIHSPNG